MKCTITQLFILQLFFILEVYSRKEPTLTLLKRNDQRFLKYGNLYPKRKGVGGDMN